MTESEALAKMIPPGAIRPRKYGQGVIQILVTSICDKSCWHCTQFSNLSTRFYAQGHSKFMSPEHYEQAIISLKDYHGVVGLFGGNPAISPYFAAYCEIIKKHIPLHRRGIWCNNPLTVEKARLMRETFDPSVSNLNVHLDTEAFRMFKEGWPESHIVGLYEDSRHAPTGGVAMKDIVHNEDKRWELISGCDINQNWSAGIGVFRGQLRAWFCEIAMAQAILHQHELDYPDTGVELQSDDFSTREDYWWQLPMSAFTLQVRKHCHECAVPLRGYGELSQAKDGKEQTSATHADCYKPKVKGREVEIVTDLVQLGTGRLSKVTHYLQNGRI